LSNTNHTENKQWSTEENTKHWATQTTLKTNNDLQNRTLGLFVFSVVCVAQCLVFCIVLCRSLFVFSVVCVAQCLVFCVVLCRSTQTTLKTNNDLQNTTQNTKHWATQTTLKTNNDLHNTTQNTKHWASVAQCLVFCVMFCRSLFVLVWFVLLNEPHWKQTMIYRTEH
jgi:lipopolysaccharide/colanic/teichoic acid biosynthesis glycosyltransferase